MKHDKDLFAMRIIVMYILHSFERRGIISDGKSTTALWGPAIYTFKSYKGYVSIRVVPMAARKSDQ